MAGVNNSLKSAVSFKSSVTLHLTADSEDKKYQNNMLSVIKLTEKSNITPIILSYFCRHGHTMRGKPPGVARTLEQRLAGKKKF